MKKRLLSLLLALALLCAALPALAEEDALPEGAVGRWDYSGFYSPDENVIFTVDDLSALGLPCILILWEDGVGIGITQNGDAHEMIQLAWTLSDSGTEVHIDDKTYLLTDGSLRYDAENQSLYFSKVSWPMQPPEPVTADSLDDYYDDWELTAVGITILDVPRVLPAEAAPFYFYLSISDFTTCDFYYYDNPDDDYQMVYNLYSKDGVLYTAQAFDIDYAPVLPVFMLPNGWISPTIQLEGVDCTLYMNRF